jgi:ketosteroid isomerase-like protein
MSQENVEAVRRVFEAFNSGDPFSPVIDAMSPDVVITQNNIPAARTYSGPQGAIQALFDWTEDFDEFVTTGENYIDSDDKVIVRVHQKALGAGSGVPVEGEFWFVFTFGRGKIVRLDMFNEETEALEAAGLSE